MAKNSNTSFAYEALVSIILPEGILNVFEVVNRLTAALTKAVSEGLIDRNPFKLLDAKEKPQKNSSIREFLTIEEVKQLMATPCRYDIVKRAFLFSCFTGLRYSDIKSLLWSEIRKAADGRTLFLEHPQVKTRKIVTVPLSEEALKWMPKQQKDKEHVFRQLQITSTTVEVISTNKNNKGKRDFLFPLFVNLTWLY